MSMAASGNIHIEAPSSPLADKSVVRTDEDLMPQTTQDAPEQTERTHGFKNALEAETGSTEGEQHAAQVENSPDAANSECSHATESSEKPPLGEPTSTTVSISDSVFPDYKFASIQRSSQNTNIAASLDSPKPSTPQTPQGLDGKANQMVNLGLALPNGKFAFAHQGQNTQAGAMPPDSLLAVGKPEGNQQAKMLIYPVAPDSPDVSLKPPKPSGIPNVTPLVAGNGQPAQTAAPTSGQASNNVVASIIPKPSSNPLAGQSGPAGSMGDAGAGASTLGPENLGDNSYQAILDSNNPSSPTLGRGDGLAPDQTGSFIETLFKQSADFSSGGHDAAGREHNSGRQNHNLGAQPNAQGIGDYDPALPSSFSEVDSATNIVRSTSSHPSKSENVGRSGYLQNELHERIVQNAKLFLQGGASILTMRLNGFTLGNPELGSLNLRFSLKGRRLETQIEVDNASARNLVEKIIPHFKASLTEDGVEVSKFDVFTHDQRDERTPSGSFDASSNPSTSRRFTEAPIEDREDIELHGHSGLSDMSRLARNIAPGRVDYRI